MLIIDLAKNPEQYEYSLLPADPILVSVRSHYTSIYIAFAQVTENDNYSGFGVSTTGFFTAYDGGCGYYGKYNRMWHLFGETTFGNPLAAVKWIMLYGDREWVFETTLPEGNRGWREVNDFFHFWLHVRSSILEMCVASQKPGTHLTPGQIKKARELENEFFARWGQGYDSELFGNPPDDQE